MPDFLQFATPHCHIQSLDSASTPDAFVKRELELGGKTLTVTDHGTLQAAQAVFALAKKKGLTPVVGLEAYFRDDDCPILKRLGVPQTVSTQKWAPKGVPSYADYIKYQHITLHFQDYPAYLCAVKLLSKADLRAEQHGSERKPLFNWSDIEELAAHNVIACSSCLIGMVQRHLLSHGDAVGAKAYWDHLHHLFGDRFYAEVFPHVCSQNWTEAVFVDVPGAAGSSGEQVAVDRLKFYFGKNVRVRDLAYPSRGPVETKADRLQAVVKRMTSPALIGVQHNRKWQEQPAQQILKVDAVRGFIQNDCAPAAPEGDVQWGCNAFVYRLAKKSGVRLLISDDSHFAKPEDHIVQDIKLSSPHHTWKFHNSYHRYSSAEAWDYFSSRMNIAETEFRGWIDNSLEWAGRFNGFKFDTSVKLPSNFYPADSLTYIRDKILKYGRLSDDPAHRARLKEEIALLHRNGTFDLLPYFAVDEEVCRIYRNQGWPTGPGRGSAGGLSLSYLLGITHIEPLRHGLSLERFMTPDRIASGKLPDIDQDLPFREPLEGWETDVVEFESSDGRVGCMPEAWRCETADGGLATIDEVAASGGLLLAWWLKDRSFTPASAVKVRVLRRSKTDPTLPRWWQGWLKERFGDCVAQMSVDSTMKLKAAVRDVARARRGFVSPDIEQLCKTFEEAPMGIGDLDHVMGYSTPEADVPGSITRDKSLQDYVAKYGADFEIVKKALGLSRHRGRHPCGFVIADRPIADFIPLQTVNGVRVTSYTAIPVEAVGGVKMDFLVVSSIHDIAEALRLIRARHGLVGAGGGFDDAQLVPLPDRSRDASIWDLPPDQAVFGDFMAGRTETVFQYHTDGAKDWLKYFNRRRPDGRGLIADIRDLSIFTALDRPGPLNVQLRHPEVEGAAHNALVEYTRRAMGRPGSPDIHPAVERLLPETHGVIIFQEQVQKIYQQITGCSGPEAEEFRGNVAKKYQAKIEQDYPMFIARATAVLGSEEDAKGVWNQLVTFAQYGFNLSHSTAYAIIGYACAWLKHHYSLEWWCGLLSHASKDKINTKLWPHIGWRVSLPDLGRSGPQWEIRDDRLQAPMTLFAGIGPSAHAQLTRYAPYKKIEDLADAIQRYKDDAAAIAAAVEAARAAEIAVANEDGPEPTAEDEAIPEDAAEETAEDEVDWVEAAVAPPTTESPEPDAKPVRKAQPRSPVHRTTVWHLAVAGALDSLFPDNTPVEEMMATFDTAMLERVGKKYRATMRKAFRTLDALGRYQVKKKILAPFGADIRPFADIDVVDGEMSVAGTSRPSFLRRDGGDLYYLTMVWDRDARCEVPREDRCTDYDNIRRMNEAPEVPEGGYRCAAVGAVDGVRIFHWGADKSSEGLELTLEIGGGKMQVTKWPPMGQDRLAEDDRAVKKGAVVGVVLTRNRPDKPFAVRSWSVIRNPL